jgi:MFS family permease
MAVLLLCGTTVSLQQTMVVPLLPDFPTIFGISVDDSSWLVTSTLLANAVATPVVSRLADMFGKRRIMILCLAGMSLGSVVSALDLGFAPMLIGRSLQGLSAALVPVGISIARDELPTGKMTSAVALISATLGIGSALGLPLSGLLYEHFGWESIFWSTAILGPVLVVALLLAVPESAVRTPGPFDYFGAVLLSIALTALLLMISKGGSWGWTSLPIILTAAASAVMLAIWVPVELRVGNPMVDLRTSARRPVLLTNMAAVLVGYSMYSNLIATTQQFQMPEATGYGFGLGVMVAGLCMIPTGIAMVAVSPLSATITRRRGAKTAMIAGTLISTLGYAARIFFTDEVWMVMVGAAVIGVGNAIAYASMPTLIMGAVPITETASANGMNTLLRSVGTSAASAVVAALLAASTITADGAAYPSLQAFEHAFWLAGSLTLTAAGLSFLLPRRNWRSGLDGGRPRAPVKARSGEETLV